MIETLVNPKQLNLIEIQLRQRRIPFRQVQDNRDGITIIIGPFHKSTNLTATMMMLNQSRFHTNFTKNLPQKSVNLDQKNQTNTTVHTDDKTLHDGRYAISVEAQEYDLAHDQGRSSYSLCLRFYFQFTNISFCHLESYEFRNCLESCEVYEGNELKPDHNCIRKKCLKEITGI